MARSACMFQGWLAAGMEAIGVGAAGLFSLLTTYIGSGNPGLCCTFVRQLIISPEVDPVMNLPETAGRGGAGFWSDGRKQSTRGRG